MAEPANRSDRPGGGKWYTHPVTEEKFDSVTTVLDSWDKDGLKIWASMLAADLALDIAPQICAAALLEDCGNTFNRCYQKHGRDNTCERCPCGRCGRCLWRRMAWRHEAESARRAEEGTWVHQAIDHWVRTGEQIRLPETCEPYFDQFLTWASDFGVAHRGWHGPDHPGSWEQTEATLINREHGYAGTSDAAIWLEASRAKEGAPRDLVFRICEPGKTTALVRVDYKTREKPDEALYNDMPLQGEAYERCDLALLPDGTEVPAPKTRARMVLQIRQADYTFKPMDNGDATFRAFLGLLDAYRWKVKSGGKTAFDLDRLYPGVVTEPMPGLSAPAKKTTAKKAVKAAAKSAAAQPDPFELAAPKQADLPMLDRPGNNPWPVGAPALRGFTDEIPF